MVTLALTEAWAVAVAVAGGFTNQGSPFRGHGLLGARSMVLRAMMFLGGCRLSQVVWMRCCLWAWGWGWVRGWEWEWALALI